MVSLFFFIIILLVCAQRNIYSRANRRNFGVYMCGLFYYIGNVLFGCVQQLPKNVFFFVFVSLWQISIVVVLSTFRFNINHLVISRCVKQWLSPLCGCQGIDIARGERKPTSCPKTKKNNRRQNHNNNNIQPLRSVYGHIMFLVVLSLSFNNK